MLTCRPATAERWDDVATVMGTRGDPAGCWCQYFRLRGREWSGARVAGKRAALREQVTAGESPPGVLAYDDDEPVGWCAVGPKIAYPRLFASPASKDDTSEADDGVWAVTCFVVRVPHRRQGVAVALLSGAVDLARTHGASVVEGYPVDPSASKSVTASSLFHGTLSLFVGAGFGIDTRRTPTRVRVSLDLA